MTSSTKWIRFSMDKNGKPLAHYYSLRGGQRTYRIGYAEAKLLIATGQAQEEPRP